MFFAINGSNQGGALANFRRKTLIRKIHVLWGKMIKRIYKWGLIGILLESKNLQLFAK